MSHRSQQSRGLDNGGSTADAERVAEKRELSPNMLGVIHAYGMGATVNARDLYRTGNTSDLPRQPASA